jgi:alpha-tubulin suppressor-like RCC1 family protein
VSFLKGKSGHFLGLIGCLLGLTSCSLSQRESSFADGWSNATHQGTPEPLFVSVWVNPYGSACGVTSAGKAKCWSESDLLGASTSTASSEIVGKVTKIASGEISSCIINDGAVLCMGSNDSGQLGNSSQPLGQSSAEYLPVDGMTQNVSDVAVGNSHVCAVKGGALYCWGSTYNGQLGNGSIGTNTPVTAPILVQGFDSGVTAVSAGSWFSCAIKNGAVFCWGSGGQATLGSGNLLDSAVPVQVLGLTSGATAISSGNGHTLAIVNGGLKGWGNGYWGQLGNNMAHSVDPSQDRQSTPVSVVGMGSGVTSVSSGSNFSCATKTDGYAYCFGKDDTGNLGLGTVGIDSLIPAKVVLTSNLKSVSLGHNTACALRNSGSIFCWGNNIVTEVDE